MKINKEVVLNCQTSKQKCTKMELKSLLFFIAQLHELKR